ncbi:hypothetical protein P167DRAFT_534364 [Morchella conica CCBAS932]|uniref:Uncharacterized protein n=1 Tax=Morchella conica CCBAS932 TaxID=1392247 RepID=A0A3N4KUF1_9PEZI|nr:hypothetical protein P167DRAFT_534364 [Morchella conica CCBAS932]
MLPGLSGSPGIRKTGITGITIGALAAYVQQAFRREGKKKKMVWVCGGTEAENGSQGTACTVCT